MFQRLYVWQQDPQWSTLWEDVVEKADLQLEGVSTNSHYLGALIIEGVKPSSPREVKRFLVIDGQQRLTTLQLLLCAYRDCARGREWASLDRTTTRLLENPDADVMEKPEEERYKIWPTIQNREIFTTILGSGSLDAVSAKYPLVRLPRRRRYEPRSNMVEGYFYFAEQINRWIDAAVARTAFSAENCAFALLQAIKHDFSVVEIALSDGDDSQEIFYSLNSQGRPLSQSDLLRSLIFMRAEKEKIDRDTLFDEFWGEFETDFWSTVIRRGGRDYSRLDLGLRYFLIAKKGNLVDTRRVNEEYRRWITADPPKYASVREELADFSRHAAIYKRFEAAPSGLPATDIRRVLLDLDVSTGLPLLQYLELEAGLSPDELDRCIGIIESFLVRRTFVGAENKEYNKYFVEIIRSLHGATPPTVESALTQKLLGGLGTTRMWPSDEEIIEAALTKPIYTTVRTPALRLLLERLEMEFRTSKTETDVIPSNLQIEHVMPQQWYAHWPVGGVNVTWQVASSPWLATDDLAPLAESIRQRNAAVHTIGNLTLVNGRLNPAAGNLGFDAKRKEYSNSVLRLNRYFDKLNEWGEDDIRARGKILGRLVCTIWRRPH